MGCSSPGLPWSAAAIRVHPSLGKQHPIGSALSTDTFALYQLMTTGSCISLRFTSREICRDNLTTFTSQLPTSPSVNKARQQPRTTRALCSRSLLQPRSCEKTSLFSSQQAASSEMEKVSCCFLPAKSYLNFLQNDTQTNLKETNRKPSNLQVPLDGSFLFLRQDDPSCNEVDAVRCLKRSPHWGQAGYLCNTQKS